jgi:hypothetical protein
MAIVPSLSSAHSSAIGNGFTSMCMVMLGAPPAGFSFISIPMRP